VIVGPDDDTVENCRLWLADPLAVNWASRATVGDLIDEIDRLRELLRAHVMDWGNCDHPSDCTCSDGRARRYLGRPA